MEAPQEPRLLVHEAPVVCVSFSPDGKTLLTGSFDGTVRFWNGAGQPVSQPLRHAQLVHEAAFSPDGKSVLVGVAGENRSRFWDLAPADPAGATETVPFPLAISPDRRTVLTLEGEKTVRLLDAATGQPVGKQLVHPKPVFSPRTVDQRRAVPRVQHGPPQGRDPGRRQRGPTLGRPDRR
jgi:WD40 repeat protein